MPDDPKGIELDFKVPCPECGGTGRLRVVAPPYDDPDRVATEECPKCHGTGKVILHIEEPGRADDAP